MGVYRSGREGGRDGTHGRVRVGERLGGGGVDTGWGDGDVLTMFTLCNEVFGLLVHEPLNWRMRISMAYGNIFLQVMMFELQILCLLLYHCLQARSLC